MQKFQNINMTKYNLPKYKRNKIQTQHNTNRQNAKIPKYKHAKIQEDKIQISQI